ncbi:hypothetical protein ACQPZP_01930 [Spirillospora sp. CA-142024]|uniref:hypothetical protein n=1 Tax=Spirillospora sp. CA-142024 TaxID=3240036 RepID=UPI003D8EE3C4
MTTQTAENGTTAPSPEEETAYLVILTLQRPTLFGFRVVTCKFTAWATPDTSRDDLLELAMTRLSKRWRKGNISFFYAEPDRLGGTA